MKLAGLDIGTTTICGLLLDPETADVVSVVTEANGASLAPPRPGESIQDPEAIVSIARRIVDGFLAGARDVRAIGVTGQMHGILYVDARGRACSPLFTWQDGRGDSEMSAGVTYASFLSERLAARVSTGMGALTHFVNVRRGQVPADATSVCTAPDYVAMRLCRAKAPVIDATNAASLGGFDLRAQDFRRSEMEALGMEPALFPRPAAGYPAVGEAVPGVPVISALGDNQASFLGSVRETRSSILVNVGTGSQISVFIDAPAAGPLLDCRPFPFGGFLAVGAALCGGRAYALLEEFFQRSLRLFGAQAERSIWETMNAVTDESLGSAERLEVDTRFAGTRQDPGARGSVRNLGVNTFTPEHLIAGVRTGIVEELLDFYDTIPAAGRAGKTVLVGSGNGLRRNAELRRAFERRLGMRMAVPLHAEEASFGAALLAGVASGALPDLAAAGRLIRFSKP